MGASRWVVVSLMLLAGIFAVVQFADRRGGADAQLAPRGTLAGFRPEWVQDWDAVGSIPAEASGTGEVVDVASDEDAVYLLQRDRWHRLSSHGVEGPHGWLAEGGPGTLAQAASLALLDGVVYVLDPSKGEIRAWDTEGVHLGYMQLRTGPPFAFARPERVDVDDQGRVYLSTYAVRADGSGSWLLLRYPSSVFGWDGEDGDQDASPGGQEDHTRESGGVPSPDLAAAPDTLFHSPVDEANSLFAEPKYGVSPDGQVVFRVATEDDIHWLDADGRVTRTAARTDSPAWPVPDSIRTEYSQMLDAVPSQSRAAYELPEYFPAVRRLVVRPNGDILLLLNAGAEDLHVEVLDAEGEPRGRLTDRAHPEPIFVTPDRLYRVRADLEATRVESLPFEITG